MILFPLTFKKRRITDKNGSRVEEEQKKRRQAGEEVVTYTVMELRLVTMMTISKKL